jgi:alcohol dehydrogenase (cytochrome c)
MAPMIFGDKVLVGISGGEYGVRGHVTAYNLRDGSQAWRAYSVGTDEDIKVDPQRTTHMGQPVGANSSISSWQGDQWKLGGGTTWGWFSYDPELNLIYYGTGNPGTWNPSQRPGDNKWSMTIMARDANTGVARWVYQMTPHDEWDYDGVNEMILVDNLTVRGQRVPRRWSTSTATASPTP